MHRVPDQFNPVRNNALNNKKRSRPRVIYVVAGRLSLPSARRYDMLSQASARRRAHATAALLQHTKHEKREWKDDDRTGVAAKDTCSDRIAAASVHVGLHRPSVSSECQVERTAFTKNVYVVVPSDSHFCEFPTYVLHSNLHYNKCAVMPRTTSPASCRSSGGPGDSLGSEW
jgi:hypothetical protein